MNMIRLDIQFQYLYMLLPSYQAIYLLSAIFSDFIFQYSKSAFWTKHNMVSETSTWRLAFVNRMA
jgi:hypothetical protein